MIGVPERKSTLKWLIVMSVIAAWNHVIPANAGERVNVYSYRNPDLMSPVFDAFQRETGIVVRTLYSGKGLIERIKQEGEHSPADVLLTVDIQRLIRAVNAGIVRSVRSEALDSSIPAPYRDPEGRWYALTLRARVLYASKDRVPETHISYGDLSLPKWKGRVCSRSGQHDYNLGLIAAKIVRTGLSDTERWLTAIRDNLVRRPSGNDRAQVKSIFSGECDIALGNTYYMGLMLTNEKAPEQVGWAKSVDLIFPDQDGHGTHVNVSGASVLRHAPNEENAVRFLEFLASPRAQSIYAETVFEYPVNPVVKPSDLVQSWGDLNPDQMPLVDIASQAGAASLLVDRVQFDLGPE